MRDFLGDPVGTIYGATMFGVFLIIAVCLSPIWVPVYLISKLHYWLRYDFRFWYRKKYGCWQNKYECPCGNYCWADGKRCPKE